MPTTAALAREIHCAMLKGHKGHLLRVCLTPFTHALAGFDSTNRTGALPPQNGVRRITSTVLKEIEKKNITTKIKSTKEARAKSHDRHPCPKPAPSTRP